MTCNRNEAPEDLEGRRSEPRAATVFRPVLIETDDFAYFCLVRNLSSRGMKSTVYTAFPPGTSLTVRFGSETAVDGTLAWCKGDHIGVSFKQPVNVDELLASIVTETKGAKLNRPLRMQVECRAQLFIDGRVLVSEVRDISQKGLKVLCASVHAGEEVHVNLPHLGSRKAVVRWSREGAAGLNFLSPLSFEELARWAVNQRICGKTVPMATGSAINNTVRRIG